MGFVSESEISPSGSISEPIAILNDLHNIELQIQRLTGREPTKDSTNLKLTEFRIKNATKIDENLNNDNVVELTQKIVEELVEDSESITVKEFPTEKEDEIQIQVLVPEDQMGRVIGREGRTAKAIRTIVQASSYINDNKRVNISIDSY